MGEILFPFVYWAQDDKNVFLRVDLRNVDAPEITLRDKRIIFQAIGEGAKGRNQYNFALDFFAPVSAEDSVYKLTQRGVEFTLKKQNVESETWWPRLTFNAQRFTWLKVDFAKWQDPDAEDSSSDPESFEKKMRGFDINQYEEQQAKEMYEKLRRDLENENFAGLGALFKPAQLTKTYLLTYNAAMFLGYLIIVCQLIHGYTRDGIDYYPRVWQEISSKMTCCQLAQFFEIFHSLVGYVKSSWKAPFLQVGGRGLLLFLVMIPEPRLHDKPFVFYLFFLWSLIEVIRYPYYFFSVLKTDVGLVTWLRYTMWIVLYPLGFLCEAVIIIRAMLYYDQTEKFSLALPNVMNVSFDFGMFLRFYLVFMFLPGMVYLLQHMRKQRVAKLCTNKTSGKRKTKIGMAGVIMDRPSCRVRSPTRPPFSRE